MVLGVTARAAVVRAFYFASAVEATYEAHHRTPSSAKDQDRPANDWRTPATRFATRTAVSFRSRSCCAVSARCAKKRKSARLSGACRHSIELARMAERGFGDRCSGQLSYTPFQ